jgi:hypothetical protein
VDTKGTVGQVAVEDVNNVRYVVENILYAFGMVIRSCLYLLMIRELFMLTPTNNKRDRFRKRNQKLVYFD